MDDRKQTFLSFVALTGVLLTAACGYNEQARFQMSFLPSAPKPAAVAAELTPLPPAQPNLYLHDVPPFLVANPQLPERKTQGDALILRADQRLQRGKRFYQAHDIPGARREFDAAIDIMLAASDQNPADRQEYERRLDEMADAIHRYDLSGLGASAQLEEGKLEKPPLEDILEMTFPLDPKLKDRVREQVASTVSQLPLSVNDTVLGYINYFSNRGHRTLVAAKQRSGRYRPMIQRILDEEGVPQELIHLAQAESGFIPRAVSRKAAGGMWQFLVWRGNQYGLRQTKYTDERMDPEKATRAAAHHLRDLYTAFGDWYLAIAAYNCGPGVVERAVERTGYADFWELRNRGVLPAETTNYVPIILAMTIMEKNAAEYGLEGLQLDPPLEYDTIEISAPTSLTLVSDITDASAAELAALNPSIIRGGIAPVGYPLHVPKGAGTALMAALQLIPTEHWDSWRLHRVEAGDTLATISRRYGASPASIISANNMRTPEAMEQGDRLFIPTALRVEPAAKRSTPSRSTVRTSSSRTTKTKPAVKTIVSSTSSKTHPVIVARTLPR
jgi:peptidoglycan lytic transglycosylase D